jgi:tripartite-type tricarboxylate transporter receptor subunit TctC
MNAPFFFNMPASDSKLFRRRFLVVCALGALSLSGLGLAQTPAWPIKQVRIVTGWPPGGNADAISRLLAEDIGKRIAQTIIVDNRPGAAGTIGALAVVRAEPDGNTLLVATMVESTVVPPMSVQTMQYDPEVDLQPVTLIGKWPMLLLINPGFPANTMAELVAWGKANPGKLTYGSLGVGTINHLTGELFKLTAGVEATHVPYKGGAPMLTDLAGGQIHFAFDSLGSALPLIQSGKVKPLAITGQQRLPQVPNVPTTAEAGYAAVVTDVWMGLFVPAKTPRNIVNAVHAEAVRALKGPAIRKSLEDRAIQPVGNTPEEFKEIIQVETAKKRQLAARVGIKVE